MEVRELRVSPPHWPFSYVGCYLNTVDGVWRGVGTFLVGRDVDGLEGGGHDPGLEISDHLSSCIPQLLLAHHCACSLKFSNG